MKKSLSIIVGLISLSVSVTVLALHWLADPKKDTQPVNNQGLVGQYRCHGVGAIFRKSYQSILTISKPIFKSPTYILTESFPESYWETVKGVGFEYGNNLVAIFNDRSYGSSVTAYRVDNGNLISGRFVYFNHSDKGFGREDCIKMK